MRTVVQVEHVSKRFGEDTVLKDVNFEFKEGKIYGIVGNNGSGKTVLMKCICGFMRPEEGRIFVNYKQIGKDVDFPDDTGIIIETPGFLTNYTGMKNLQILASMKKRIGKDAIRQVLEQVGLNPDMKKHVGKYSLGMRQRLGIAQAIMENPSLLILDEPFNGLDKHGIAQMHQLLMAQKKLGKTIILASHNPNDINTLCDEVCEMDAGVFKVLREGSDE